VRLDATKFMRAFLRNAGPLAPVLVVAALVSVFLAAESAHRMGTHFAARATVGKSRAVELMREPITPEQALRAAQRVSSLVPAVRVQVSGNSVVVSVQKAEQVAEWMYALSVVQTTLPSAAWEPRHVCLSVCDGGDAARAYVTAFRSRLAATN
jgi:hypothetical protein